MGSSTASTAGLLGIGAGAYLFKSGLDRGAEAQIHEAGLKEMADSLGAEIGPHTIALADKTVTLTGTVDEQYAQWRAILNESLPHRNRTAPGAGLFRHTTLTPFELLGAHEDERQCRAPGRIRSPMSGKEQEEPSDSDSAIVPVELNRVTPADEESRADAKSNLKRTAVVARLDCLILSGSHCAICLATFRGYRITRCGRRHWGH